LFAFTKVGLLYWMLIFMFFCFLVNKYQIVILQFYFTLSKLDGSCHHVIMFYCSSYSWAINQFIFNCSFSVSHVDIWKNRFGYCVKVTKKVRRYGQLRWLKELAMRCNVMVSTMFCFWI
jgi:hypothetical protein